MPDSVSSLRDALQKIVTPRRRRGETPSGMKEEGIPVRSYEKKSREKPFGYSTSESQEPSSMREAHASFQTFPPVKDNGQSR